MDSDDRNRIRALALEIEKEPHEHAAAVFVEFDPLSDTTILRLEVQFAAFVPIDNQDLTDRELTRTVLEHARAWLEKQLVVEVKKWANGQ